MDESAITTTGRPTLYTEALADEICEQLMSGLSLRRICEAEGMPHRSTVLRWQMSENKDFAAKCARARVIQADALFDDMASLEDRALNGEVEAAVARVVLSSQQWRAAKLDSKKYGDTGTGTQVSITNQVAIVCTEEQRARLIALREQITNGDQPK